MHFLEVPSSEIKNYYVSSTDPTVSKRNTSYPQKGLDQFKSISNCNVKVGIKILGFESPLFGTGKITYRLNRLSITFIKL